MWIRSDPHELNSLYCIHLYGIYVSQFDICSIQTTFQHGVHLQSFIFIFGSYFVFVFFIIILKIVAHVEIICSALCDRCLFKFSERALWENCATRAACLCLRLLLSHMGRYTGPFSPKYWQLQTKSQTYWLHASHAIPPHDCLSSFLDACTHCAHTQAWHKCACSSIRSSVHVHSIEKKLCEFVVSFLYKLECVLTM